MNSDEIEFANAFHAHEMAVDGNAGDRAWMKWINRVEAILGHSADGDHKFDGYSMDGFYNAWRLGVSPDAAASAANARKLPLHGLEANS